MSFPSSFHGAIEEIPGISIDNFENPAERQCRAYFLSHCHTDHTKGLHSLELLRYLQETNISIYMSEHSAAIVEDEAWNSDIMKYVKALPAGKTTIALPSIPSQNLQETCPTVTLIPAGHCFGSVMFLFKTDSKTVLFTGDFRINQNDLPKYGPFHDNNGDPIVIDALYVDTTFLSAKFLNFPKRSETIKELIEKIGKWLTNDAKNRIALHMSARYGYEYVYNEVFERLGLKTYVNDLRWRFYSKLLTSVPGVTNDLESSKLHLCTNWNEHSNHSRCLKNFDETWNFLFIHFSARKWEDFQIDGLAIETVSEKRLNVCFATHCSRSELIFFKNYLNPKKVVGFPNKYDENSCNENEQTVVKKKKLKSPEKEKVLKEDWKVDQDELRRIFGM